MATLLGCGTETPQEEQPVEVSEGVAGASAGGQAGSCSPPPGVSGSPRTIDALVRLLNALPRPTSVACFLESLERPLDVHLTRSTLSVQPAGDDDNPRIFIVSGNLTMAVVPAGPASSLLEFGYFYGEDQSVKGEVVFPITETITDAVLAEQLQLGGRTRCGSCHDPEQPAGEEFFEGAYVSKVIAPSPQLAMSLEDLRQASDDCDEQVEAPRCEVLAALFDHGELRSSTLWPSEPQ